MDQQKRKINYFILLPILYLIAVSWWVYSSTQFGGIGWQSLEFALMIIIIIIPVSLIYVLASLTFGLLWAFRAKNLLWIVIGLIAFIPAVYLSIVFLEGIKFQEYLRNFFAP